MPTEQLTLCGAMRTPVITIRPRKPLHAAATAMEDAAIRRLVVTDERDAPCSRAMRSRAGWKATTWRISRKWLARKA